jgi:glycogen debranching enzyme
MAKRRGDRRRAAQHRSRERILAQHEPAKIRRSDDAVVLEDGNVFLLTTQSGDAPFELPHGPGLFFRDCRHLDGLVLTIDGRSPTVRSGIGVRGLETHHHLSNPALGRENAPRNTVAVTRRRVLRGDAVHQVQTLRNCGREPVTLGVELRVRARFEDVFVVKGFVGGPRGAVGEPEVVGGREVRLSYDGQDGLVRATRLACGRPHRGAGRGCDGALDVVRGDDAEEVSDEW